jgi:hypothetical protein
MCPRTVRLPKEARTYSRGEKKTRKEVHNTRTSPELFPLLEHGRRLTSFADDFNIDNNAGIKTITIPISTRHAQNTNNTRSCRSICHLPAHHTHHVSPTTVPRRLQWNLPSSRHSNKMHHDTQLLNHQHIPSTAPSVHAHAHMYTPASVFSCIELARLLPHSSAARAGASHTKLPQHASTGSQSSTLKSTRSTFRSPDRLWGLSS